MSTTSNSGRTILLVVLGIVALCCLCVLVLGAGAVAYFQIYGSRVFLVPTPLVEERSTPTPRSAASTPKVESTLAYGPNGELPAEITDQMDVIEQNVRDLRQIASSSPVPRLLLSSEQLRQRVVDDFFKDYSDEDARRDTYMLAALGLLEPDFDLRTFYVDLFSEQVAGFYDNDVKEMYVVQGEGFKGPERLTYAHEFTHALQDQKYDIENGLHFSDKECNEDTTERCSGIQALLEGEATFVSYQWFGSYGTSDDQKELLLFSATYKMPVYESAPEYMKRDFMYPYESGLAFVTHLYENGGWPAVDRAYQNPPISSEQILHPDLYPDETPVPVDLPDLTSVLGSGWEKLEGGVMGEWYTQLILADGWVPEARLDLNEAQNASEGWGGDAYGIYLNASSGQTALVLTTVWDTKQDVDEFSEAFTTYANARFGVDATPDGTRTIWEGGDVFSALYVTRDENRTVWVLAPDAATAEALWNALNP